MKYLNTYETINWEFDEEEEEKAILKKGDTFRMNDFNFQAYYPDENKFLPYGGHDLNTKQIIFDVKHSSDAENMNYGEGISKIYNGLVYRIDGKWPWYKV